MDWDSDLELKTLRQSFIASFSEREKALKKWVNQLASAQPERIPFIFKEIQLIIHKIAGASGSYGLPTLSKATGILDDWFSYFSYAEKPIDLDAYLQAVTCYTNFVIELMAEVCIHQKDPELLLQDPRMVELINLKY